MSEQPQIVTSLTELHWLNDVVAASVTPVVGMVDVLVSHQDAQSVNGGRHCICGEWEGPWTGTAFAEHVALALNAAGYDYTH